MSKDSIDSMIESWSKGVSSGARESVTPTDSGDLKDWSAPTPPKAEKPSPEPGALEAAQAIRKEIGDGSGPKKGMWTYRNVVRDSLGLKQLSTKVFEAVLQFGYDSLLFELDDSTGSYPLLRGLDTEPEPEPASEPEPEVVAPPKPLAPPSKGVPDNPPKDWVPQGWLACGHHHYQDILKTEAEMTDGEKKHVAESKDSHGPQPRKTIYLETPEGCPDCANQKPGNARFQTGKYRTPLPMSSRRSAETEGREGFPGYCADPTTGFYIGGVGNDCRRYHSGPERCVAHTPRVRPPTQKRKSPSDSRKEEPST